MTANNNICTATRPASDQVCTRTAKTRAIASWHRDKFLVPPRRVPGSCPDTSSANATSLYCRAVRLNDQSDSKILDKTEIRNTIPSNEYICSTQSGYKSLKSL